MELTKRALIAVALVLMLLPLASVGAYGSVATAVTRTPDSPKAADDVQVTLELENASNVTSIYIIVCTIEPFACELPANMTRDATNVNLFRYAIAKDFGAGTRVGFKFKIYYNDSTEGKLPESTGDSELHPVEGPFQGSYYFVYKVADEPTDGSLPLLYIMIPIIVIVVIALAAVLLLRKKKGKQDEPEK